MRTRILTVPITAFVIASLLPLGSAQAAAPKPVGPTLELPSYTTGTTAPGGEAGGPGTFALNSAVSTKCNAGSPIGGQQWFVLPTGELGMVYARARALNFDPGHSGDKLNSTQLAFVDYVTNKVLSCGGGPTAITGSDHAAVVVYWDPTELLFCRTSTSTCGDGFAHLELFVNSTTGSPSNADSSTATQINALPYTQTADGALVPLSFDLPLGLVPAICNAPFTDPNVNDSLWWKYTATKTGDLPVSVESSRFAPPTNGALFTPWEGVVDTTGGHSVNVPGLDADADGCGGFGATAFPVVAGHTYLIQTAKITDPSFNPAPQDVQDGPVTLRVGAVGALAAPPLTTTTNGAWEVGLHWTAPLKSAATAPISSYRVTRDGVDASGFGPQTLTVPATATAHIFGDLKEGTYTFTVAAVNATGVGVPSTAVVTVGVPNQPATVATSVDAAAQTASLTWAPPVPAVAAAVTGYRVSRTGSDINDSGPWSTVLPASARSATFRFLAPSSRYTVSVQAVTAGGAGPAASRAVTMPGPPDEPAEFFAGGDNAAKTATMDWLPPLFDGGSPITGFLVSRTGTDSLGVGALAETVPASAVEHTFTHLNAWVRYTINVQAVNAIGAGPAMSQIVTFTAPTPGPPTGIALNRGNRSLTVHWRAPAQHGSSAIKGYRIREFAGSTTTVLSSKKVAASARSFTATGLTNGTPYSFDVTAINRSGIGSNSHRTAAQTPAVRPSAPVIGIAAAGVPGGQITALAAWSAPTADGGAPIIAYRVTALRMSTTGVVLDEINSPVLAANARSYAFVLPILGDYRFVVRAFNAVGSSPPSARSNLVAAR